MVKNLIFTFIARSSDRVDPDEAVVNAIYRVKKRVERMDRISPGVWRVYLNLPDKMRLREFWEMIEEAGADKIGLVMEEDL